MGIKKKKLRERAQSDYIRFKKHAFEAIGLSSKLTRQNMNQEMRISDLQAKIDELRNEQSGEFPIIASYSSFVKGLGSIPELDPLTHPHKTRIRFAVLDRPDTPDPTVGFSDSIRDTSFKAMELEIVRVMVPKFRRSPIYGYKLPAGIVLVDMDPRE